MFVRCSVKPPSSAPWWPALASWSMAVLLFTAPMAVAEDCAPRAGRVLVDARVQPDSLRAVDLYAIGVLRSEEALQERALARTDWPPFLRALSRGRWEQEHGRVDRALVAYRRAFEAWPREGNGRAWTQLRVSLVLRWIEAALVASGPDAAAEVLRLEEPVHDPRLLAWSGRLALERGDTLAARAAMDSAFARADSGQRQDPVFLGRYRAYLGGSDRGRAAEVFLESVEHLRRPASRQRALELYARDEALRRAAAESARRMELAVWLARRNRREEALELARAALADSAAADRSDAFALGAEQLYRLRRHDALRAWLGRDWPEGLDEEQRAELEALPWGMARREGPSLEVARGFDQVALRHPGTEREAEAWWEAAWMYALSERPDSARVRYERYLRLAPTGPYAAGAAARILESLRREGAPADYLEAYQRLDARLGEDFERALALRWAEEAVRRTGDYARADSLRARLRAEHPASPFWVPLWPVRDAPASAEAAGRTRSLFEEQRAAFLLLGRHLGVEPFAPVEDPALAVAARMAEWGWLPEAEIELDAWLRAHRSDSAALFRGIAVAWCWGLADLQARHAWALVRRMQDETESVVRAAQIVGWPTPFAPDVLTEAAARGIDPALVWAQMRRESFYDPRAVSVAGAYGLLQLLPETAARMERRRGHAVPREKDLLRPQWNLRVGIAHLDALLEAFDDEVVAALAAYNAGEAMARIWRDRWGPGASVEERIMTISYSETRAYVYHLLRHRNVYRQIYAALGPR